MKIGLYFGSFNPVHHGHLIIANHVVSNTELQQVWLVISPQNPHKKSVTLLNEYHRFHLVQLALEGENNIKASNIEFQLPRPSYTVHTLAYLREKYPQHEFAIIMGSDSYCNLPRWKNATVIMKQYPVYVYQRAGFEIKQDTAVNLHLLEAPLLQISSTQIRTLIKEGKSIRYLVPDSVKEEIESNSYYR